jgi:DNA-binding NarL/FixJ family response regulator
LSGQLLTARKSQVLELLFRRLTNKEIAGDLKISERMAKFHVCIQMSESAIWWNGSVNKGNI